MEGVYAKALSMRVCQYAQEIWFISAHKWDNATVWQQYVCLHHLPMQHMPWLLPLRTIRMIFFSLSFYCSGDCMNVMYILEGITDSCIINDLNCKKVHKNEWKTLIILLFVIRKKIVAFNKRARENVEIVACKFIKMINFFT
jgi:hypothetical protein